MSTLANCLQLGHEKQQLSQVCTNLNCISKGIVCTMCVSDMHKDHKNEVVGLQQFVREFVSGNLGFQKMTDLEKQQQELMATQNELNHYFESMQRTIINLIEELKQHLAEMIKKEQGQLFTEMNSQEKLKEWTVCLLNNNLNQAQTQAQIMHTRVNQIQNMNDKNIKNEVFSNQRQTSNKFHSREEEISIGNENVSREPKKEVKIMSIKNVIFQETSQIANNFYNFIKSLKSENYSSQNPERASNTNRQSSLLRQGSHLQSGNSLTSSQNLNNKKNIFCQSQESHLKIQNPSALVNTSLQAPFSSTQRVNDKSSITPYLASQTSIPTTNQSNAIVNATSGRSFSRSKLNNNIQSQAVDSPFISQGSFFSQLPPKSTSPSPLNSNNNMKRREDSQQQLERNSFQNGRNSFINEEEKFDKNYQQFQISSQINCIEIIPGDKLITGTQDGYLRIWQDCKVSFALFCQSAPVISIAYQDSTRMIISGAQDGIISVWKYSPSPTKALTIQGSHKSAITTIIFQTDRLVITAAADSSLILWDIDKGTILQQIQGYNSQTINNTNLNGTFLKNGEQQNNFSSNSKEREEHLEGITDIVILDKIFLAARSNCLEFWELNSFKVLKKVQAHQSKLNQLSLIDRKFKPRIIATCSDDGYLALWESDKQYFEVASRKENNCKITSFAINIPYDIIICIVEPIFAGSINKLSSNSIKIQAYSISNNLHPVANLGKYESIVSCIKSTDSDVYIAQKNGTVHKIPLKDHFTFSSNQTQGATKTNQ